MTSRVVLFPLGLLIAGCGPSDAPPMGTVSGTIKVDGAVPPEPIRVVFASPMTGQSSDAEVEDDGTYELEHPLPVGEYQVYFTISYEVQPDGPISTDAEIVRSLPREYQTDASTPLKEAVEEGENVIDLEVPKAE